MAPVLLNLDYKSGKQGFLLPATRNSAEQAQTGHQHGIGFGFRNGCRKPEVIHGKSKCRRATADHYRLNISATAHETVKRELVVNIETVAIGRSRCKIDLYGKAIDEVTRVKPECSRTLVKRYGQRTIARNRVKKRACAAKAAINIEKVSSPDWCRVGNTWLNHPGSDRWPSRSHEVG